jgi:hypothetical protein
MGLFCLKLAQPELRCDFKESFCFLSGIHGIKGSIVMSDE